MPEHRSTANREELFDAVIGLWLLLMLACVLLFWVSMEELWGANNAGRPADEAFLQLPLGLTAGIATLFSVLTAGLYVTTNLNLRREGNYGTQSFAMGTWVASLCAFACWVISTVFLFEEAKPFCDNVRGLSVDPTFTGNCTWMYAGEAFCIINILTSFGMMVYGFMLAQDASAQYYYDEQYYYGPYDDGYYYYEEEEGEDAPEAK